jgi:hypothetical protein
LSAVPPPLPPPAAPQLPSTGAQLPSTGAQLPSTGAQLPSTGAQLPSTTNPRLSATSPPVPEGHEIWGSDKRHQPRLTNKPEKRGGSSKTQKEERGDEVEEEEVDQLRDDGAMEVDKPLSVS